jgi:DNA mismatch repair protein MSH2
VVRRLLVVVWRKEAMNVGWFSDLKRGTYHVFIRESGYSFYGVHAVELGATFFQGTTSVVKVSQDGLDSLTVSKKMLGEIASYLLIEKTERLQLWKRADESSQWVEACPEASPGRYGDLEKLIGGFFGGDTESRSNKDKEPVIASLYSRYTKETAECRVGLSIFYAVRGVLKVFDFLDDKGWSDAESLLIQHGVREVLVADSNTNVELKKRKLGQDETRRSGDGEYTGTFKQMLVKAGVAITQVASSTFKVSNSSTIDDFDFLCESSAVCVQELNDLTCGGPAFVAVVEHMQLGGNHSDSKSYQLEIAHIESYLQYDSNVCKALGIFKTGGSPSRKITHSAASEETGPGNGEGVSFEDIEDDIFGDIIAEPNESGSGSSSSSSSSRSSSGRISVNSSTCLFDIVGLTKTIMGHRLLKRWLQQPSRDLETITKRQDVVEVLCERSLVRSSLRDSTDHLMRCPDLEKVCQKFRNKESIKGVTLSDLITIYRGVERLKSINNELIQLQQDSGVKDGCVYMLDSVSKVAKTMEKFLSLVEELIDVDALNRKGISGGDSSGWKRARLTGERWIQVRPTFTQAMTDLGSEMTKTFDSMERERLRVADAAGIEGKAVHLESNSVQGIHLRVTKKEAAKVLKKLSKEGVKTLSVQKSGTMFVTAQMINLAKTYGQQKGAYQTMQNEVVLQAASVAATYVNAIGEAATALAEIDCLATLAHVASLHEWCRPRIERGAKLELHGLRHPVVEAHVGSSNYRASDLILRSSSERSNNETCDKEEKSCTVILTGPNMGGKSTFIRAVGVAVILGHCGSFIPAKSAAMPLFDRVLTRVGADDSLAMGVSTFMKEMMDLSNILRKATKNSLVIVDELGRGTSTHEGYGLAWGALEQLSEIGPMTLFATHFHELTLMESTISNVINKHVDASVDKGNDKVSMLYEVKDGAANDSMGFAVARLAGFPEEIVRTAEDMSKTYLH